MKQLRVIGLLGACFAAAVLASCSTHHIWNIGDRADLTGANTNRPPYDGKVFLTAASLPITNYEVVGQIDIGKVTTENTESVLITMADKCRTSGANVVLNLKTWRQPSGWTWSGPHGSGTAVRVADTNALAGLKGYWY